MGDDENTAGISCEKAVDANGYVLSPEELKRRRQRNLAIAASLAGFIVLVFAVTVLRLGASVSG